MVINLCWLRNVRIKLQGSQKFDTLRPIPYTNAIHDAFYYFTVYYQLHYLKLFKEGYHYSMDKAYMLTSFVFLLT